jgi:hypothetical protein
MRSCHPKHITPAYEVAPRGRSPIQQAWDPVANPSVLLNDDPVITIGSGRILPSGVAPHPAEIVTSQLGYTDLTIAQGLKGVFF